MCCCISGEPIEDSKGKIKTFHGEQMFQTDMLHAPCVDCPHSCFWFTGQFIPACCGVTQCMLRKKVLGDDMTKYSCFQGYFNFCCGMCKAGNFSEESCPEFCMFLESCCCNSCAISASRMYVMEKYDIRSDPCDYRIIRINNCLQILSCVCNILAIFISALREIARIIDWIADIFYHCVSGCMTAQVAHEVNYQVSVGNGNGDKVQSQMGQPVYEPEYAPQGAVVGQPVMNEKQQNNM